MTVAQNISELNGILRIETGVNSEIKSIQRISGGSINEAYKFTYGDQKYFMKINDAGKFPEMFECEISGLNELKKVNSWKVPTPVFTKVIEQSQFLVLNYLESVNENGLFFFNLGESLAKLHQIKSDNYGYPRNNYIGSLIQNNTFENNWDDFFYYYRLEPLLEWCFNSALMDKIILRKFENFRDKIKDIFPNEKPCMLHGDLWNGNKMNTPDGPCVFDPAVYYGHREMDLAMTKLFGGFNSEFYDAYENAYPLQKNWKSRVELCNLYPLLVHVKLFGTSYLHEVIQTIKKF